MSIARLISASLIAAAALTAVASAQASLPRFKQPIVIRNPNPQGFHVLSNTHYVSAELGTWAPIKTSVPTACVWFGTYMCIGGENGVKQKFDADFGEGIDISSVNLVVLEEYQDAAGSIQPGRIQDISFDRIPSTTLMHLTGFVDYAPTDKEPVVNASLDYAVPREYLNAGWIELAIQTQDDGGNWIDRSVAISPAMDERNRPTNSHIIHSLRVAAQVPQLSAVRMELRASAQAAADENFTVSSAKLLIAECIPDAANTGTCL